MGPQPANLRLLRQSQKHTPHLVIRPRLAPQLRRRTENPVIIASELSSLFPRPQDAQHSCVNRHLALRVDRLYFTYPLADDASADAKFAAEPVDVKPLQGKAFADPQTKRYTDQCYRAEGFRQERYETVEFFHS